VGIAADTWAPAGIAADTAEALLADTAKRAAPADTAAAAYTAEDTAQAEELPVLVAP